MHAQVCKQAEGPIVVGRPPVRMLRAKSQHDDRSPRRPRQNFKWRSTDWRQGTSNWRREDRWLGGNSDTFDKKLENRWHHDRFSELQAEELADASKKESGEEQPKNEHILPDSEVKRPVVASRNMDETGEGDTSDWKKKDANRKAGERDEGDIPQMRNESHSNREREVKSINLPSSRKVLERGHWGEDRELVRVEKDHEQDRASYRGGRARRFGGRVRERWGGRNGRDNEVLFHDRWKHDLFDEANRSPTPKQEEDPIAKVEALLAA
ncbi:hypothetical protein O6H91_Y088200 [Diphasiastrum complanatum]|nr:hypothetical protein O6H91_Y088200 [Diphasiastrum complanatum]